MGTQPAAPGSAPPRRTSIADALFTKGQQRVLAVLFGDAGRSFYANEIIARAGIGTGAVQRELARLESAGLVTVTRIGKQKHYQANLKAPVYDELRGLVLKTAGLADVLREALAPVATEIRAAFVFGSVAKREDTARSDIDLFVATEALRREPPDAREFEGLVRSARVRLVDAQKPSNGMESRFDLAYNAAHALCLAALRRLGYRPANRYYVVFQALPHTLGLGPEVWGVLAKSRRVRNEGEYEGNLNVSERLVADLIAACRAVEAALAKLPPLT